MRLSPHRRFKACSVTQSGRGRQVVSNLRGWSEELRCESVGLHLGEPGPGLRVVVHEQVTEFVSSVEAAAGLVLLGRVEHDQRPRPMKMRERVDAMTRVIEPNDGHAVSLQQPYDMRHWTARHTHARSGLLGKIGDLRRIQFRAHRQVRKARCR